MATDAFTYSDGDLDTQSGGVWVLHNAGNELRVTSNTLRGPTSNMTGNWCHWSTAMSSTDHYSELEITALSTTTPSCFMGVVTRMSTSGETGYLVDVNNNGASSTLELYRVTTGTYVSLDSATVDSTGTHTVRLESIGSEHKVYWDDVETLSATDSNHTGSYIGVTAYLEAQNMQAGDNWAGDVIFEPVTLGLENSSSNGTTGAQTFTSGSFTPTANSTLFVFAMVQDAAGTGVTPDVSITDSTGALTWTRETHGTVMNSGGDSSWKGRATLFWTDIGGSPVSMTVTVDPFTGAANTGTVALTVFEATSAGGGATIVQKAENTGQFGGGSGIDNASLASGTLAATTTSGRRVVACFGVQSEASGTGASTVPSGWTALDNMADPYPHNMVIHRNDFAGTSVTCTDLGEDVGMCGAMIFELEGVAGGAGEDEAVNPVDAVGITDTADMTLGSNIQIRYAHEVRID